MHNGYKILLVFLLSSAELILGQEIKVYFSQSVDPTLSVIPPDGWNVRLDSLLAEYINRAEYSVDMCIYDWDSVGLPFLAPAIRNAVDRGIKFRLITDDGFDTQPDNAVVRDSVDIAWSIPRINDTFGGGEASMHCKFFIIDGRDSDTTNDIVIVSSSNLTINNLLSDANNTLVIHWAPLTEALETQFNIYWGSSEDEPNPINSDFSSGFPDIIQHIFYGENATIELYFSPQKTQYEDSILKRIYSVQHDVFFCINRFRRSGQSIDDTLKSLFYRGVNLKGVFGVRDDVYWDMLATNTGYDTVYNWNPSCQGIVFPDSLPSGTVHSKYLLGDVNYPLSDPFVLTGSMNWTDAGFHSNNECVIIIHSYEVGQKFYAEFATRYIESGGSLDAVRNEFYPPQKSIRVFPNPAYKQFFVAGFGKFDVIDITGKSVYSGIAPMHVRLPRTGLYIVRSGKSAAKVFVE